MSTSAASDPIEDRAKEQIKYEIIFREQAQVLQTNQTKFNEAMANIQQSPLIAKQGQHWKPTPDKNTEQPESVQLAILRRRHELLTELVSSTHPTPSQDPNCEAPLSKPLVEPRHITNEELQLFQNPENLHGKQFILSPDTSDSGLYEVIGYSRKRDSELLRGGHTVRGCARILQSYTVDPMLTGVVSAVRSRNVARVNKSYESFGDKFSVTAIDDLVTSDLSDAVKGVDAIIHVAYALPNANPGVVLDAAVSGTTRILDAALAAGIKKLFITESVVSLAPASDFWDITITEECEPVRPRRLHEPARLRAHLRCPGRPVSGYDPASGVPALLNVDVRDVARAHVLALKLPPSETQKRFALSTNAFTWKEAIELLAKKRPELKGRLPVITGKEPPVGPIATWTLATPRACSA
ncbi:hypothetical protein EDB85DRAFT_1887481 [Lactarius pseudohatsudake]|nr:hypothetical protein EDB85DRAFT_1887481 [Lactarius pseudohatsudake]